MISNKLFRCACLRALALLLLLGFTASCQTAKKEALSLMISLNEVDMNARGGKLMLEQNIGGQTLRLSSMPLITNYDMTHAECMVTQEAVFGSDDAGNLVEKTPARYALKIFLTNIGKSKWRLSSADLAGDNVALLVGGRFKCFVAFEPYYREGTILLRTDLSEKEVDALCTLIKSNYKALVSDSIW